MFINHARLMEQIKKHEGCVLEVYLDTEGVPTVGFGHALHPGSKVSQFVADLLFQEDYKDAILGATELILAHDIPDLNPARTEVITNMVFNMGASGVGKFKNMISALQTRDYTAAAMEMLDSKWAEQVKGRAYELSKIMETGQY